MKLSPEQFWTTAAQWGSMMTGGDPGACMYGFDERGVVQSETHRRDCLAWIELCRGTADGLPNPKVQHAELDDLAAYLKVAVIDDGRPAPVRTPAGRQFLARHVPDADLDLFQDGYFECAEWLASGYGPKYESDNSLDDDDRAKLKGFTRAAVKEGKADCRAFCDANAADIKMYCELSGRDMSSAGHDFWLSRNGHGAGFFDRGNDPVFDRLQDAARVWSTVECSMYRNRLIFE